MKFTKNKLSNKLLRQLYLDLVTPRLIEEKMLLQLRQGKISKWFSGIGQEAVAVGAASALREDEYILPLHRNLGVFTQRKVPLDRLFAQFLGKPTGFTKGRDRSFHFGTKDHHIIGMISHLGSQLAVADGIALGQKLRDEKKVVLAFTGEGASSEGDFHEALNVAAVWGLPVIFLVENNGYSISTPVSEQFFIKSFTEKGDAYGIRAHEIDGNNILEVYQTIKKEAGNVKRTGKPVLIEAKTFRMRGHEESSGTDYVPEEVFEEWLQKDPVECFRAYLLDEKIAYEEELKEEEKVIRGEINKAWKKAWETPHPEADPAYELGEVFAPYYPPQTGNMSSSMTKKRFVDAISESLDENLRLYPELILMGQDVAEYGGVFKVTKGLVEKYGKDRIRNTPLCESAIMGIGMGLSITDYKSVIEMQFADFVSCGFNQLVNNLAKSYYRWGQHADVVVRMPTGAGLNAGPYHSQSTEAWFFNVPGLKIVYPSSPADAKGLLNAAIKEPNPVMYYEHKALYRSLESEVPDNYYTIEIGKGRVVQEGDELTVITYGMGVHWVLEYLKRHSDVSIQLVDLRTLQPWDKKLVADAVRKTGRVLVLNEDTHTGSISADIASWIGEELFEALDAPVMRLGSLDTPVPFNPVLEKNFLASSVLDDKLQQLRNY